MESIAEAAGDHLAVLLEAWRQDIESVPVPELIDVASAAKLLLRRR
jgi:hypothetical protein